MKKYITFAAFFAVAILAELSFSARAEDGAAPAVSAKNADAPAVSSYEKDHANCDAMASVPVTEGEEPSAEMKAGAVRKCLLGKGHSEDEIKAHDVPAAPAGDAAAPAASDTK